MALDLQVVTKLKPVFMTWLKGKSDDHQGLKSSTYYLSSQDIINVITLLKTRKCNYKVKTPDANTTNPCTEVII